ncbi:MAG: MerR family transcriptional regulator [Desulfobaccales bacterium]
MCAAERILKSEHRVTSLNPRNDKVSGETDINQLDGMLTIEQVSKLTGLNKTTLRYWERKYKDFLLPKRTETRQRQYSLKDIKIIKTIKRLQDEEFLTFKGIYLRLKNLP